MKDFKKLLTKFAFATAFMLGVSAVNVFAQGPPPGNGGPVPVPIDGGASLLLAGGVAYGIKKIRDNRRRRKA